MVLDKEFKLVGDKRLLPGIHGLRGIAAVAVVLFHIIHLTKIQAPAFFNFIGRDFGYGVHLFFILSAFSLMHSTQPTLKNETWCYEYFIKRFFRIVPLFYFIIFVTLALRYIAHVPFPSIDSLVLNFTLSFGAVPWAGLVSGGWTIGVETIFYILLPVLLLIIKSRVSALILILSLVPLSTIFRSILTVHYAKVPDQAYNWSYFSFSPNMCFFGFGIYIFYLAKSIPEHSFRCKYLIPIFTSLLLLTLMLTDIVAPLRNQNSRIDIILWGLGFSLLTMWQAINPNRWFANSALKYIGERSYSVYLLHPIIIQIMKHHIAEWYKMLYPYIGSYAFFICAILTLLVTIVTAELTYRYIEVPGINIGRYLNSKIRATKIISYSSQ